MKEIIFNIDDYGKVYFPENITYQDIKKIYKSTDTAWQQAYGRAARDNSNENEHLIDVLADKTYKTNKGK